MPTTLSLSEIKHADIADNVGTGVGVVVENGGAWVVPNTEQESKCFDSKVFVAAQYRQLLVMHPSPPILHEISVMMLIPAAASPADADSKHADASVVCGMSAAASAIEISFMTHAELRVGVAVK